MTEISPYRLTGSPAGVVEIDFEESRFQIHRDGDSISLHARQGGTVVEVLNSVVAGDGLTVTLEDECGTRATYSGGSDGEAVTVRVEAGSCVREARGTAETVAYELERILADVDLPNATRIFSFARSLKAEPAFREKLFEGAVPSAAAECPPLCGIACGISADTLGTGIGLFSAGYCAACVVHVPGC
ncbi:hypothetical protein Ga0074812_11235 [Parafrankia irregularis]|uniref:Uncharacterized protein n=1 Tax=Parafrankia irregularis TaxID=795642 RepID=A0A0S4QQH4_9ACTN|nr:MULTISPECIES: hypothetical protein [Parafrankia]MBE3201635.1 hypothetical protein [Parafrankia sp. CH37]CUU57375.1 hypothetical protein Ga0074812_11235 [Parafrankia irregularis]